MSRAPREETSRLVIEVEGDTERRRFLSQVAVSLSQFVPERLIIFRGIQEKQRSSFLWQTLLTFVYLHI